MNQKQNPTRPQRDEHGLTAEEVEQVEQHDHECDTSSHHDDHYEPLEDAHGEVETRLGLCARRRRTISICVSISDGMYPARD